MDLKSNRKLPKPKFEIGDLVVFEWEKNDSIAARLYHHMIIVDCWPAENPSDESWGLYTYKLVCQNGQKAMPDGENYLVKVA